MQHLHVNHWMNSRVKMGHVFQRTLCVMEYLIVPYPTKATRQMNSAAHVPSNFFVLTEDVRILKMFATEETIAEITATRTRFALVSLSIIEIGRKKEHI